MKIFATALAKNEADVIGEGVREALSWVDAFVIYDSGSTDGTPELAEQAGAVVLRGPVEPFNEGLRQHMLDALPGLGIADGDVVMRIDPDEMYHIGGPQVEHPRALVEREFGKGAFVMRAIQAEFWLTLDDVRRGAILEDERASVQKRRRWYTIGHTATVAWRWRPDLRYYMDVDFQKRRNVPINATGWDVGQLGPMAGAVLLQKHYNCRSLGQVLGRMKDRRKDLNSFGKYRFNLICDETYGLHYLGPDDIFDFRPNHDVIYQWYGDAAKLFEARAAGWGG